jgi:hypothetical protein
VQFVTVATDLGLSSRINLVILHGARDLRPPCTPDLGEIRERARLVHKRRPLHFRWQTLGLARQSPRADALAESRGA